MALKQVLLELWIAFFSVAPRPTESLVGLATIGVGWVAWRVKRKAVSRSEPKPDGTIPPG